MEVQILCPHTIKIKQKNLCFNFVNRITLSGTVVLPAGFTVESNGFCLQILKTSAPGLEQQQCKFKKLFKKTEKSTLLICPGSIFLPTCDVI
jgi:hypothetical protein